MVMYYAICLKYVFGLLIADFFWVYFSLRIDYALFCVDCGIYLVCSLFSKNKMLFCVFKHISHG